MNSAAPNPRPAGARAALITVALLALAPASMLARSDVERYSGLGLPAGATATASSVDALFGTILWITLFFLILVTTLLVTFAILYRRSRRERAQYATGNARLEALWIAVPALVLGGVAWQSNALWTAIKRDVPDEATAFVVLVKPRQFQWDVVYPGPDKRFGTADDSAAVNRIDVPAGRDVVLLLEAQDVVHSFFVPEFRIKQDAVPGMTTRTWFNAPTPGRYEIACSELCGLGHYRMRGEVVVHGESGDRK